MKLKKVEITADDLRVAIKRYHKDYPYNEYYDGHYKKDWRTITEDDFKKFKRNVKTYHVVWAYYGPYPLKVIYLYAHQNACKRIKNINEYEPYNYTADFHEKPAEKAIHDLYQFRTDGITPAIHFNGVFLKKKR
jgi:hypothetical protein